MKTRTAGGMLCKNEVDVNRCKFSVDLKVEERLLAFSVVVSGFVNGLHEVGRVLIMK